MLVKNTKLADNDALSQNLGLAQGQQREKYAIPSLFLQYQQASQATQLLKRYRHRYRAELARNPSLIWTIVE